MNFVRLADRVVGPWVMPIAFVPLVLGVVTGWIMISRNNRQRLGLVER